MGHHQYQALPRTPPFKRVIALLGESAGGGGTAGVGVGTLEEVAAATLAASDDGLTRAKGDDGLGYCLYIMATIARASNERAFGEAMSIIGISLKDKSKHDAAQLLSRDVTVFDLVSGFSATVDAHLRESRNRTDISEMAQLSACESLSALCAKPTETLFGTTHDTVEQSLQKLGTQKGFATLAHDFFARLSRRFIEYHLSRELSNHVGPGRRFSGTAAHNKFLRQLDEHCRVTTGVVKQFAGEWYSKHKWQKDITARKTKAFAAHAVEKVRDAFRYQEARNAV